MSSPHILLVEDDSNDVELTLAAFQKCGVASEIAVVRDGEEALNYLDAASSMPKVVLLDLKLPKIGGLEILSRIRADERTRRLPVVVLTSSLEESDLIGSYDLGANSFVRKPVDFVQFSETARQLAQYWLRFNETPASRSSG